MITLTKYKEYLLKNKYLVLFISVLLLFGVIVGLYLGISHIELLREDINYYVTNINSKTYNYLLFHFFVLVIGVITSFFAIGIPLLCTLIFYEGMSMGFLLGIFTITYQVKGLLFVLIFLIITKLFYLICLIMLFSKTLHISRKMIGKYIYKTDPSIIINHLLKGCMVCIALVLIYDVVLWFSGSYIVSFFKFLLT